MYRILAEVLRKEQPLRTPVPLRYCNPSAAAHAGAG